MKETHITIYIHDLEISDKSKSFLARVGLMKLDDLLNCNMTELSAMRNISEDVLQELNGIIAHSDVIISFFEERAKLCLGSGIKKIGSHNFEKCEKLTTLVLHSFPTRRSSDLYAGSPRRIAQHRLKQFFRMWNHRNHIARIPDTAWR